ncbi:phosphopantetheine-binding protein [Methyloterricola oryzae]|uniref:phosphopantetheine-binding protein n=1 Tax=Methyloterricola oryzae TaxID=1495050 RepID=UPI0005EBA40D|nr:phosphopantetheine-binding protein [Methyloterricola oryzae]
MQALELHLKELLIRTFDLEGMTPADIDAEAPLFGGGLGLDSIDALELGVALRKQFHIQIDTDSSDLVRHFASVRSLAGFIALQQELPPS